MQIKPSKSNVRPARAKYRVFDKPMAQIEHDLSLQYLTAEDFHDAQRLIRACGKVGVWRLKQGELTEDAGFYLAELINEMAHAVGLLIQEGDLMLARRLPPVVKMLQEQMRAYGAKITGSVTRRLTIEQLLKRHKAHELLAMLLALQPNWHLLLLHVYHSSPRNLPVEKRNEILLRKRRKIEMCPEERLRQLLLSKERFVGWKNNKRIVEWRKHGLAAIIENIYALRGLENENINLFVEHLWRGWLWGMAGSTFVKCDWHGRKDLPARDDVGAWMKIVMPFLRRVTQDNAMKLGVFKYMLAARKPVFAGRTLAEDKPGYIWNQIENRIRKAWRVMSKRATKRKLEKTA